MRIDNIEERQFYEIESVKNDWSLSELKRQYNSSLYERLTLSHATYMMDRGINYQQNRLSGRDQSL